MDSIQNQTNSAGLALPAGLAFSSSLVFLPILHVDEFARLNGLSNGVVNAWLAREYLPYLTVGRYKMVNLVKLTQILQGGAVI